MWWTHSDSPVQLPKFTVSLTHLFSWWCWVNHHCALKRLHISYRRTLIFVFRGQKLKSITVSIVTLSSYCTFSNLATYVRVSEKFFFFLTGKWSTFCETSSAVLLMSPFWIDSVQKGWSWCIRTETATCAVMSFFFLTGCLIIEYF